MIINMGLLLADGRPRTVRRFSQRGFAPHPRLKITVG